jgi:hypothetical protein
MRTPAEMIAVLDRQLAKNGADIVLRRRVGTSEVFREITLRGRITGQAPNPLAGSVKQVNRVFILSPTKLTAAILAGAWPLDTGTPEPRQGDELRDAAGVSRRIETVEAQRPNGVAVRFDGQVLG